MQLVFFLNAISYLAFMNADQLIQDLIYRSVYKISTDTSVDDTAKMKALFHLFHMMLEEATKDEEINFTTLFSRIAYMGNVHKLEPQLLYYLHTFRRSQEQNLISDDIISYYLTLGYYVINTATAIVWEPAKEKEFDLPIEVAQFFKREKRDVASFTPLIECLVVSVDLDHYKIDFIDEADGTEIQTAQFDVADKNEIFNRNIAALSRFFDLPIHANLIDVELLRDGTYVPQAIVVKPDHLMDVTAIAETFKYYGTDAMLYVVNKFRQKESSPPLMIGNIANYFLDVLIADPDADYATLEKDLFQMSPIEFTLYDDETIIEMLRKVKTHFYHLQKVVKEDFQRRHIDKAKSYLEPSFLSRAYGLQGRLDMLHYDEKEERYDIIELKSGKPFRTNTYGLNNNHYVQALLYDLLIRSAFGAHKKPNSYILYSVLAEDQLRYAPPVKAQQYEAMRIRNDLITLEQNLSVADQNDHNIFTYLRLDNFPKAAGYDKKAIVDFAETYQQLTVAERSYLHHFVAFIAREQSLSKTGIHGLNQSNGHAALWLESIEEKEDRFSILSYLQVAENLAEEETPQLTLRRTKRTNPLANFRVGDIAVLYPYEDNEKSILNNQIFKCTILHIDAHEVHVRLRSQQYNHGIFRKYSYWNIEEDSMDSGFNTMYRSLYRFCKSDMPYRQLIMGVQGPRETETDHIFDKEDLTDQQNALLSEMVSSQDYYLLWGPPGTGKTSVMLKQLIKHLIQEQGETVLVLAYTNRAVDEICAAISSLDEGNEDLFVRIGSRYSCNEKYKPYLLDQKVKGMQRRSEIATLIQDTQLYVSTVSSIVNRTELLQMKQFDTIVIDEASQILEPMLVGLLSYARRFIMIGDHKQLPAVVTQSASQTVVRDSVLQQQGITDLRMSLFERLYKQCHEQQWTHAIGILSQQGRMHQQIMQFPNEHFYQGQLSILDRVARLSSTDSYIVNEAHRWLCERCIYIDTPVDSYYSWKTNDHEANAVERLLHLIIASLQQQDMTIHSRTIGVITPYRAQIAKINTALESLDSWLRDLITIDTVERYQGGARDIIILSLCTNKLSQLESLVSLSSAGIDRKLNVALTRAKEQIIILGNRSILEHNDTYARLLSNYHNISMEQIVSSTTSKSSD